MDKYAIVDRDDFPIVRVTFTGTKATAENFQIYLSELKSSYNNEQKLPIIFDANKATLPGLNYQRMQAQWIKENKKMMQDYCAGTAYVISNSLIKNVLKGIFSIQKQPVPYLVCSYCSVAENWVKDQLCLD